MRLRLSAALLGALSQLWEWHGPSAWGSRPDWPNRPQIRSPTGELKGYRMMSELQSAAAEKAPTRRWATQRAGPAPFRPPVVPLLILG